MIRAKQMLTTVLLAKLDGLCLNINVTDNAQKNTPNQMVSAFSLGFSALSDTLWKTAIDAFWIFKFVKAATF